MSILPRHRQQTVSQVKRTGTDPLHLGVWATPRGARIVGLLIISLLWLNGVAPIHLAAFLPEAVWAQEAGPNTPQVEPAAKPDFIADSLEVTQAVQDLNNSVRLVADKRTFVRFHAHAAQASDSVSALLKVERGGQEIWLLPLNAPRVVLQSEPDRGVLNQAFLFELPAGFTQDTVTLTGYLNYGDTEARELDYANNSVSTTVTFEAVPVVNLVLYRMGYQLDGVDYWTSVKDRNQLVDWLQGAYPVSDLRVWDRTLWMGEATVDDAGELTNFTCASVNAMLVSKKIWDSTYATAGVPMDAHYYALVDDGGGFMRGCALGDPYFVASGPTGSDSWGWDHDGSYGDWYGGHELALTFGQERAGFCGADAATNYPYPLGRISPVLTGADALYGFDIKTQALYGPAYKDLMTQCGYQWISDFTYQGLMDFFQGGSLGMAARRTANQMDRLLITGSIDPKTNGVNLEPLFVIPNAGDLVPSQPGPYTIVLKDEQGQELARYAFTPRASQGGKSNVAQDLGGKPTDLTTLQTITELVPYAPGTARVEILAPDSASISSVIANPSPPQVMVISPAGGETFSGTTLSVNWTSSDDDGDQLFFNVQYSADDGQSWEMVAQGVTGNGTALDLAGLAASQAGRLRVWASDGIHTAFTESAPFIIPNRAPAVYIRTPSTTPTVAVSQTVTLVGSGYDVDTGPLTGADMTWTSNLDGNLGHGLILRVADLSVGSHIITLRTTDDQGASATAAAQVIVVADVANLPAGSTLDGLVVGPAFLSPSLKNNVSGRNIYVDNKNIIRSVNWTAVSDQPWLVLGKTSGVTPDVIPVSVNWTSVNWTSVNWTSVNWTSVNWTSVNWTSVNWTGGVPTGELLASVTISSTDLSGVIVVPVEMTMDPSHLFMPQLKED